MALVAAVETGLSLLGDSSLAFGSGGANLGSASGYSGLLASDLGGSLSMPSVAAGSGGGGGDSEAAWAQALAAAFQAAGTIVPTIAGVPQKNARAAQALAEAEKAKLAQASLMGGAAFPGQPMGYGSTVPQQAAGMSTTTVLLMAGGAAVVLWLLLKPSPEGRDARRA